MLESLPLWSAYLLIAFIALIDIVIIAGILGLSILFTGFRIWRFGYNMFQKYADKLVNFVLCCLEDVLESSSFRYASGIPLTILSAIKAVYDILSRLQDLVESFITLGITLAVIIAGIAGLGALLIINMVLIWLLDVYVF